MSHVQSNRVRVDQKGDVAVVRFADKRIWEDPTIEEIGEQLIGLVERGQQKKLLLNFTDVEFVSSAAVAMLITLHKKVQAASAKMKLCSVRPEILEVLKVTQLHRLFEIHGAEQEAVDCF